MSVANQAISLENAGFGLELEDWEQGVVGGAVVRDIAGAQVMDEGNLVVAFRR